MRMPRGALLKLSSVSAKRWPAAAKAPVCMVLSLDVLPAVAQNEHSKRANATQVKDTLNTMPGGELK